jgi:hypothetical protein
MCFGHSAPCSFQPRSVPVLRRNVNTDQPIGISLLSQRELQPFQMQKSTSPDSTLVSVMRRISRSQCGDTATDRLAKGHQSSCVASDS